jgi:hypothetical protein
LIFDYMFSLLGYKVILAANGKIALDLIATSKMPDFIVMDVQMYVAFFFCFIYYYYLFFCVVLCCFVFVFVFVFIFVLVIVIVIVCFVLFI